MSVNGALTSRTLPSPLREMIDTMVLLNPAHHVIASRFGKQDSFQYNQGDTISRIAVEKLPLIADAGETYDNAPLAWKYAKRSYQINWHSGHCKISSKLMDTSIEDVAGQSEALLSIAAQETSENQIIKMLLASGIPVTCTKGVTAAAAKINDMTELNKEDLDNIYIQLRKAQIEPCYPEPVFGSNYWGSQPRASNQYALILPIDYMTSLEAMARDGGVAVPIEKVSRDLAYNDTSHWGTFGRFSVYFSTLMTSLPDTSSASSSKRIYQGIILGQECFAMLNGLQNVETIYRGRAMSSAEGNWCSVGKRFPTGSGPLRPDGIYTITFTDYKKA